MALLLKVDGIDEVVARYGKTDAEIKELKKANDADKEHIKKVLEEQGESSWTAGGYTVQRVESTKETMNESKLLPLLKFDWRDRQGERECPYIKTREYIDMDALEVAIYAGEIPVSVLKQMDSCRETTTTVALRCKKVKEA